MPPNKIPELQEFANSVYDQLPPDLSLVELACEITGFLVFLNSTLHKSAFRDAVMLCYHWTPPACPISCACGHNFTIDHSISCPI